MIVTRVLFFSMLLFSTLLISQNSPDTGYDYLIEIKINIIDEETYFLELINPIPNEFYETDLVKLKFVINNPNSSRIPYFAIFDDALLSCADNESGYPLMGVQSPIIVIPPPSVRTSTYEFISDCILPFNANSLIINLTSRYFWDSAVSSGYNSVAGSVFKWINVNSALPDLITTSAKAELKTEDITVGQLQSTCTVSNIGKNLAAETTIAHYISTDTILDKKDIFLVNRPVPSLNHQQTAEIKIGYRHVQVTIDPDTDYYMLYVVDSGNSVSESNETNNISHTLLLKKKDIQQSVKLYPNPAKNQISIKGIIAEELLLYNIHGLLIDRKEVKSFNKIRKNTFIYDISQFPPGIYYCHVYQNGEKIIKTFIKE